MTYTPNTFSQLEPVAVDPTEALERVRDLLERKIKCNHPLNESGHCHICGT
jgi:hypothetical protein